ncbi:MAG: VacJ family lipoprotein [Proteobacteria bacterium]|nr:VacJ family lipoprotein [Pseudomonadota bacterium]
MKILAINILLTISVFTSGCATGPHSHDPLEPMNRKIYGFNESLDQAIIKPAAQAYASFVPSLVRTGVHNFFTNLGVLNTMVNNVLQLKIHNVPVDIARFTTNLILGVGGLFDAATRIGIPYHNEDFGQTLGYWGVGSGPYLVLPLLGASTLRDGLGKPVDYFLDPGSHIDNESIRMKVRGMNIIDIRAHLLPIDNALNESAIDKYSFIRDTWLQRREYQIREGSNKKIRASNKRVKSLRELELEESVY